MSVISFNTFVLPGIYCFGYRMVSLVSTGVLEELSWVEVVGFVRKFLASKRDVGTHSSSEVPVADERLGVFLAVQFGKLQCFAHHG